MLHFLRHLVIGLVCAAAAAFPASAETKLALVIGNANYESGGQLPNPVNDARLIASSLESIGFKVYLHTDLKRRDLFDAVEAFIAKVDSAARGEKVIATLFYAGHGLQQEGENYLIPVDARISKAADIPKDGYSVSLLLSNLERVRANVNLIILDACRNNPFFKNRAIVVDGLGVPKLDLSGSLIAFSTAPGKLAADGAGANSPYSEALAKHLKRPGLKIEDVLKETGKDVIAATSNTQVPWSNSSLTQDVYLAGEGTAQQTPDISNVTETPCEISFAKALQGNSIESYEAFIRACPNDPRVPVFKESVLSLADENQWKRTQETQTAVACRDYLRFFPQGNHRVEAEDCFGLSKPSSTPDDDAWKEAEACVNRESQISNICDQLTRKIACAEGYRRSQGTAGKHDYDAVEAIDEFNGMKRESNCAGLSGPAGPGGGAQENSLDGDYIVTRGYDFQRDRNCLRTYPDSRAALKDGLVTFDSDGRSWIGSVDANRQITIDRNNITPRPKQHFAVYGALDNAVMESGYCGTGWFRMTKVESEPAQDDPTPPPSNMLPDGTYEAERGYTDAGRPKPQTECPGSARTRVRVAGGWIQFTLDGRLLRASQDENGTISVDGNNSLMSGRRFKSEFTISGHYSDAGMYSGYCGSGFFRIQR